MVYELLALSEDIALFKQNRLGFLMRFVGRVRDPQS